MARISHLDDICSSQAKLYYKNARNLYVQTEYSPHKSRLPGGALALVYSKERGRREAVSGKDNEGGDNDDVERKRHLESMPQKKFKFSIYHAELSVSSDE